MAVVEVTIIGGRSQAVKDEIHRGMADVLVRALKTDPGKVRVVIREIAPGDYSVGGRAVGMPPDLEDSESPKSM